MPLISMPGMVGSFGIRWGQAVEVSGVRGD
jgi:hypothetical protein